MAGVCTYFEKAVLPTNKPLQGAVKEKREGKKNAPCKEADPWIALSYFDLLAQTFGVGTCWCGFGVYAFRLIGKMRKALNLPPGYKIGAVLLFGKPAVNYPRATRPEPFAIASVKEIQ